MMCGPPPDRNDDDRPRLRSPEDDWALPPTPFEAEEQERYKAMREAEEDSWAWPDYPGP